MSTPLQFFKYKKGKLSSDGIPLEKIAKAFGTPVYIYSERALVESYRELRNSLKKINFVICYSIKANSNPEILDLLRKLGAGADIVSGGELMQSMHSKISPNKIVFSGVGKTWEEMEYALRSGISAFHVESEAELHTLNAVALNLRIRAPVALRFNPDVNPKTHRYIATGLKKHKFGLERKEILSLIQSISKFKGIQLKGISIHIGSQILSLSPFEEAFKRVNELLSEINPFLQKPLSYMSLGGGLGISYRLGNKPPAMRDYCQLILKYFNSEKWGGKIILEPGRLIVGNSGVLVTQILYKKPRGRKDFLIVDAGMNDLMRPALYGSFHEIIPLIKMNGSQPKHNSDIVGPVCESGDCFGENRPMPAALKAGDLLAILSAGAYGYSMSNTYNCRARPAEVLISNGKVRLIRPRELLG